MNNEELKKEMIKDLGIECLCEDAPYWIYELAEKLLSNGWIKL